jgi:hypothetical protein
MSVSRRHAPALFATALLLVAAPACASYHAYRYPSPSQRIDDRAYWKGFEEGRKHGDKDRRDGKRFDYARHGDYRDADDGYKYGDRNAYRHEFRRGFVDGYENAYRGAVGARYPNGPGPYVYEGRDRYPVYDGRGRYPGDGSPYGNSAAFQNGYRDGYDQGRKDAKDRDRFDPLRSSRYRSGDHDYDRRDGPREDYRRDYRAAFQQGYDRGYREYRR